MQNAKDSFFEALRGRLVALNPERTVVVRGVTRPGLVVNENETQSVASTPDCFHMSWTGVTVTEEGALPLLSLSCEVRYCTAGSAMNGGLDRGRALAAMDGELLAILRQCPQNAPKSDYSALAQGGAAVGLGTRVWWSNPTFGPIEDDADQLARVATVQVMSFQEAGER